MSNDDHHVDINEGPITSAGLREIRTAALDRARDAGLDPRAAAGFALAVSEAASNTLRHAHQTGEYRIVRDDQTSLYAEVSDTGPGLNAQPATELPAPDATSGRGLWLMRELADHLDVESSTAGTTVRVAMDVDADE